MGPVFPDFCVCPLDPDTALPGPAQPVSGPDQAGRSLAQPACVIVQAATAITASTAASTLAFPVQRFSNEAVTLSLYRRIFDPPCDQSAHAEQACEHHIAF